MYEQISSNKRKSVALFLGFLLLYGAVAAAVWWYAGDVASIIVGVVAVGVIVVALVGGDDIAVRVAGARQIERKEEAPELWRLVENLSIVAGIPMPRIYVSPDPSANAFAAGRSPEQAVVCVNQGLLELLDDRELEGVLAHELSHIRNYDVRLMTMPRCSRGRSCSSPSSPRASGTSAAAAAAGATPTAEGLAA